jgi:phenylpropionate dioxygenase-like ring-hydroxylating dioxygenase large terminal subunit
MLNKFETVCKDCGRKIVMIQNADGRWRACNPQQALYKAVKPGGKIHARHTILLDDGTEVRGFWVPDSDEQYKSFWDGYGWFLHAPTCREEQRIIARERQREADREPKRFKRQPEKRLMHEPETYEQYGFS